MTVRLQQGQPKKFTGLYTDTKPMYAYGDEGGGYLPAGSEFFETDTRCIYIFDGAGTWTNSYIASRYYLDSRITITIAATSSHLSSGGTITKYGEQLYQYTAELSAIAGAPTVTINLVDSNGVYVYTSTAITNAATVTVLPAVTARPILDGTYTVMLALSTNPEDKNTLQYVTLGYYRG